MTSFLCPFTDSDVKLLRPFTASTIYYHSLWQVSLVRQRTLTRLEHLVLPFLQCALMFERSTRYVLFTEFGTSMNYSLEQLTWIRSYLYLFSGGFREKYLRIGKMHKITHTCRPTCYITFKNLISIFIWK